MFGKNNEIVIMAIAGIALILFLITIFIFSIVRYRRRVVKEQEEKDRMTKRFAQELLQSKLETQEETFRHIAKELHDNVGQLLSTTKMLMGVTELKLGHTPDTLYTASATLAKAIQELRMLSRSLDKEWLERFDFLENLRSEVERINSSETIKASIRCNATITMKPEEQIILFRIVQEAMQNAVRHAEPSHLSIVINNGLALEVKVINDGKPLPPSFYGMGTANMQHRAKLFGGSVDWQSAAEETIVTICLPLNNSHEN
jgi:signal transduction histidine kinase